MEISSNKGEEPLLLKSPLNSTSTNDLANQTVQLYYPKRSSHFFAKDFNSEYLSSELNRSGKVSANLYTSEFQLGLFLKTLMLSLLYSFGVGAIIVPIIKGMIFKNLIHNYLLIKSAKILSYLSIVSSLHLIQRIFFGNILSFDILSLGYYAGLIFFSIGVASIPAYSNKTFARLFSSIKLKDGSFDNRYGYGFYYSSELAKDDVQFAISTLNINPKMFYLRVLEENIECLQKKPENDDDNVKNLYIKETESEYLFSQGVMMSNLIDKTAEFEKNLFLHQFQQSVKSEIDKDQEISGYNVVLDLITGIEDQTFVSFSLVKCFLSFIFLLTLNVIYFDDAVQNVLTRWLGIVFWFIFSMLPQCFIFFSMNSVIDIMETKYSILKQLISFISTQRRKRYAGTFINAYTLNIFDLQSLKTWMNLRRIFMQFGQHKIQSSIRAILMLIIFQFLVIPLAAYLYYLKYNPQDIDYSGYFRFYYIQSMIYFATLLIVIYLAGKINKMYRSHIRALKINKQQIIMLFKTYPNIQDQSSPLSRRFMELIEDLKNEFGEGENIREEKLLTLVAAYDYLIEQLGFEEMYNPVKICGIPIRLW